MGKRKATEEAEPTKGESAIAKSADPRGSFLSSCIDEAKKRSGGNSYMADEHKLVGLPLDNLALMQLINMDVWPIQRLTITEGTEQSGKSAFFYWLCKLYVKNGGMAVVISTEQKDSPTMMLSMIGEDIKYVNYQVASSTQDWQWHITNAIKKYKAAFDNKPFPLLIGVDSVMGVMDETVKAEILKQGFAVGRGFPVTAAAVTYYLQAILSEMTGWPIALQFVNHTKQKLQNAYAEASDNSLTKASSRGAGALHLRFSNTLCLWFHRMGDIERANWKGFKTRIRVEKNALGDAHNDIDAVLAWSHDPQAPGCQRTWWDWDTATSEMLLTFERTHPIFDVLKGFKESSKSFSCEALGVEKLNSAEFGKALNSNPEILDQCITALGIHRYTKWTPGIV